MLLTPGYLISPTDSLEELEKIGILAFADRRWSIVGGEEVKAILRLSNIKKSEIDKFKTIFKNYRFSEIIATWPGNSHANKPSCLAYTHTGFDSLPSSSLSEEIKKIECIMSLSLVKPGTSVQESLIAELSGSPSDSLTTYEVVLKNYTETLSNRAYIVGKIVL